MSRKLLVFVFISLFFACSCGNYNSGKENDDIIPETVVEEFHSEFPDVQTAGWSAAAGYYKVKFIADGLRKEVTYDKDGRLLASETEIMVSNLKPGIISFVIKNYPTYDILKAIQKDRPDGTFYLVKIEKGDAGLTLKFNEHGGFVNSMNVVDTP